VGWTFDPLQLAPVAVAAAAYALRARTLARRGRPVGRGRVAAFAGGLLLLVAAFVTPLDSIGETRLFSLHMAQHLLIGDLAPLLVVLGLSGPLLRPLLAPRAVQRLRVLTTPLVALPLWAADLWLWHVPRLYDAALRHDALHALEHLCFFGAGVLLWTTLLALLPAPRWFGFGARVGALGFVWAAGGALANVFLWSSRAHYPPYVHAPRTWGFTPLADQRLGGGLMLLEMSFVVVGVFVWLGLQWLAEAERRQLRADSVT
jgi:cytochrome c oxidase assembly factor CtaG